MPYLAYRTGSVVARALPAPVASRGAEVAGVIMASGMKGRRTMLERHLRRASGGDLPGAELDRQVRRTFASYARYWAESFRLPGSTPAQLAAGMTSEGLEHVERGVAAGKGVILALPHLGGWDFGGAWLASLGFRMVAVVETVEPPELFEWFVDLRRSLGLEVLPLGPSTAAAALRRLREGAVVALVCDRDIGGTGVEVDFFGEATTLPGGPATLALRSGAALVPCAIYFGDGGTHHAVFGEPLDTTRHGRLRDDVERVTRAVTTELEGFIRRAPDQWHLLQPNWPSDFENRV
ncbi:MAG: phosphatidylinositol mannoside acyltransferase [Acidimicrobiales bacterium]